MAWQKIAVVNFGSHFAHKITRTLRLLGFHAEPASPSVQPEELKGAAGTILSDGPESLQDPKAPSFNKEILSPEVPVLGVGYGHLLLAHLYGGRVDRAMIGEFGSAPDVPESGHLQSPAAGAGGKHTGQRKPQGRGAAAATRIRDGGLHQGLLLRRHPGPEPEEIRIPGQHRVKGD